jgi:hypothetical protein
LEDSVQQQSPDPVLVLVRREILKVVKKSFLIFLVTAFLLVVSVGTLSFILGGGIYPWTPFEEIFGFILAIYAGTIYLLVRLRSSQGLGAHFYIMGIIGLSLGGFLFSWAGYSMLSAGYYERQASKNQHCKCWKDNGDLVAVGGETLACLKCSRRIRIGFDVPRLWNKLGLAAIVPGIILLALNSLLPGFQGGLLNFLGYLLLFDGIVLGVFPFTFEQSMAGYVRLPPDQSDSANTTPR